MRLLQSLSRSGRSRRQRRVADGLSAPDRDRLLGLLGYANPFAASLPIAPSPARPPDLLTADFRHSAQLFSEMEMPFDEAEVRAALAKDTAPIPANDNREGYFEDDHLTYWISGFVTFKRLAAMAAGLGVTGGRYFDFGGSTGRVFRHFAFQSAAWDVWSSDFKISSVEWNLQNFPGALKVFQGMYFPILPVEDRTFDLVSAMSVFTHIDEVETAWLLELRRVMKPGAVAILTIHNEDTFSAMHPRLRASLEGYDPGLLALKALPEGRTVSTWRRDDPYRCNVFHSNSYIRTNWGRYFEVVDIVSHAFVRHAAVVLRKPS